VLKHGDCRQLFHSDSKLSLGSSTDAENTKKTKPIIKTHKVQKIESFVLAGGSGESVSVRVKARRPPLGPSETVRERMLVMVMVIVLVMVMVMVMVMVTFIDPLSAETGQQRNP
jgi:hypothetical protein